MATKDRFPYQTSTVLDQDFLDVCQDNLTNQLEMICEIQTPGATIYASDRNKYVGSVFYEALLNFPVIRRTVGEWLSTQLEFSTIDLDLTNVDGRFNDILPGGANFGGWIGKTVVLKLGLRDVASTYTTVFSGFVTDIGGFGRTVKSITITARDRFDSLNIAFPNAAFTHAVYPDIVEKNSGKIVPVIYGDWTTGVTEGSASVPATLVNTADVAVTAAPFNNLQLVISDNVNSVFDTTQVYLKRGSDFFLFSSLDIVNVSVDLNSFEINQDSANTQVDGANYEYGQGDNFFVKVKGKDIGAFDDNIVSIARDILETYGGLVAGDFDANWVTFRDKAAPAESNIAGYKCRVWIQDPQTVMQFALSLLEQVRLEAFISRDLKVKISSLHFDDWIANPAFSVKNWDVGAGSFSPRIDQRNNFNRARADFAFLPDENENSQSTSTYRNQTAITQAGKEISKKIVFPNLYVEADVVYQAEEMIKLASSYLEVIELELTWRALLLDVGDFVKLDVNIGSTLYSDIPAMIREIGYDPAGLKIPLKVFSFQMVPFPGFAPGYAGITGGSTATITEET